MKNTLKKALIIVAILGFMPLPVVAQPSVGMFGSDTLKVSVSASAGKFVPKIAEEVFEASVSAYSSTFDQTDRDPFTAANGNQVHAGMIACSRELPFGATVTMKFKSGEIFTGVCGDRMAKKFDHATNLSLPMPHLDIWMTSRAEAKNFGRKVATVSVRYSTD